ncbi:MAG: 23S rRNA (adenine(2503)-C(2))-methyltransferase RlmN [Bdellovibrionaceae bacterium]|nr:23S rRNA (adenine(2503)-C(2))-methyltransferase RlmN [Pseudobdellovibrionaceae bacterium]
MPNFFDLTLPQLTAYLEAKGHKAFRSKQLWKWVYQKSIVNTQEMSDLSQGFQAQIPEYFSWHLPKIVKHWLSKDGTLKFLLNTSDGLPFESVLIPSKGRLTICLSSEVGCNLACDFCFTGKQKLKRRLKVSEIVGQVFLLRQFLFARPEILYDLLKLTGQKLFVDAPGQPKNQKLWLEENKAKNLEDIIPWQASLHAHAPIGNIVFMGMGEPLDNEENVFNSISILKEQLGFNYSGKKITLSTVGLVDKIPLVVKAGVRLAVSLNASNDNIRTSIMPINKKWNIETLLNACNDYVKKTGELVTFEYVLLKGITDSLESAEELYALTKRVPCKINLIPFNPHPGSNYETPSASAVDKFHQALYKKGAQVLLRRRMGSDIYAACGQLTSLNENMH